MTSTPRTKALYQSRRAAGRCTQCGCRSTRALCPKHRAIKSAQRADLVRRRQFSDAPFVPEPSAYLALHRPERGARRLHIGKAFAARIPRGTEVVVERMGTGLRLLIVPRPRPNSHTVRGSKHRYVTLLLKDFPEERYPTQKYWAELRGKQRCIVALSAQPVPHRTRPACVAASGGVDAVGSTRDREALAVEVVESGSESAGSFLDHEYDSGTWRIGERGRSDPDDVDAVQDLQEPVERSTLLGDDVGPLHKSVVGAE